MSEPSTIAGKIITFYSFKGGTGRTMSLANMGCWLAQQFAGTDQRVLLMDWDLEAPGLSKYFAAQAEIEESINRPGLINYFHELQQILQHNIHLLNDICAVDGELLLDSLLPLEKFLIYDVVDGVDLLKAGRIDDEYRALINTFNWAKFFEQYGGIIEVFRRLLTTKYAYCLIDSRTGFTDVSGICTMLMPEKLVLVFTPNRQSLSGVIDVGVWATQYRRTSDDLRPLALFPLPSRIENAELKLKEEWRELYQREFEGVFCGVYQLDECDLRPYFNAVQLPHYAYYSYGEKLAVIEEQTADSLSLRKAYEVFFDNLTELDVPWHNRQQAELTEAPADIADREPLQAIRSSQDIMGAGISYSLSAKIFISYAHIDNSAATGGQRGWVDHLHEVLELRLTQLLGFRPTIWRDKAQLSGNRVFRDTIAIGLADTSIFLSVLSPRYLDSPSCREELDSFLNAVPHNGGLRLGDKSRIFKIIKTPIDFTLHPEPIRDLLGYEFYAQDLITKRFREFDYEIGPRGEKDRRYWDKLDDLAQDIASLLKEIQVPPSAKPGLTIYLAETTSDLIEQRDKLRRELRQTGHVVLPDKPLPTSKPELEARVRDYLQRSRLSVHLIGAHYGLIPDLEVADRSIIELQQELARERSQQDDFSSLIWLPPGLEPRDERQRIFIAKLKDGLHQSNRSDLIESKFEDLKTIIQKKLNPTPKPTVTEKLEDGLKRIYLVCDQIDLEEIGPLYRFLYDEGCEVLLPEFDENTIQADKQHMLDCDAVLFYFASPPEIWVRTRLRGLTGFGRTQPLSAVGVFVAGQETPQKKLFQTREAIVIKNFGAFDPEKPPEKLTEFLAQVKGGAK